jgi:hypothetical protein
MQYLTLDAPELVRAVHAYLEKHHPRLTSALDDGRVSVSFRIERTGPFWKRELGRLVACVKVYDSPEDARANSQHVVHVE